MKTLKIIFIIGWVCCSYLSLFAQHQSMSEQNMDCIEESILDTSCATEEAIAQPSVAAVNIRQVIAEKEALNENVAQKKQRKVVRVATDNKDRVRHTLLHQKAIRPKK